MLFRSIHITNVIERQEVEEWKILFTCTAPVRITPGEDLDRATSIVSVGAVKIPDDIRLTVDDYYEYDPYGEDGTGAGPAGTTEGESVILTEPGCYIVEIDVDKIDGSEYGFTRYLVCVQADSGSSSSGTTPPAIEVEKIPASGTAKASAQTVTVDGKKVEFQMYALLDENGNGTNYIKLRDMAHVLNGTKAQFSVGYSNETGISATTGQPYQNTGSEMDTPFSGDRAYTGGTQSVWIDGEPVAMTAISLLDDNGGGYTYFKLRDLGKALGFDVGWSADRGVYVETDKPYVG